MTYRRVNSIEEYVLLEQSEHEVTVHRRADQWKPQVYSGPDAVAEFKSISLSVPAFKRSEQLLKLWHFVPPELTAIMLSLILAGSSDPAACAASAMRLAQS